VKETEVWLHLRSDDSSVNLPLKNLIGTVEDVVHAIKGLRARLLNQKKPSENALTSKQISSGPLTINILEQRELFMDHHTMSIMHTRNRWL